MDVTSVTPQVFVVSGISTSGGRLLSLAVVHETMLSFTEGVIDQESRTRTVTGRQDSTDLNTNQAAERFVGVAMVNANKWSSNTA